jgi:tetratricopeptide (TPR) repeat protein
LYARACYDLKILIERRETSIVSDTQQGGQDAQKTDKGSSWKTVMAWVGGASAILGLIGALSGWFHTFSSHHTQSAETKALMATAASQEKQGEYEASVKTYGQVLKNDPVNAEVLDAQLNTTMEWVENFQVLVPEGQSASGAAGPLLDEIMPVLDAGLARSKGTRAADVQAHLGWAHWLNWHVAEREFGSSAEKNLRAAIELDKTNVYANAMLGNWMLQNHGSFQEAIGHFNTAVATGKARPLVRQMQIGGLLGDEVPGARAEIVKAANDMRKNNEPLDDGKKHRVLTFCCNTTMTSQADLVESLSAVPTDDAWKTYLWLDGDDADPSDKTQGLNREFIQANLLEISGKRGEALEKYKALQQELKDRNMAMKSRVDEAVKRLTAPSQK